MELKVSNASAGFIASLVRIILDGIERHFFPKLHASQSHEIILDGIERPLTHHHCKMLVSEIILDGIESAL